MTELSISRASTVKICSQADLYTVYVVAVTYDLVKRTCRQLSLPMTLHHSLAPGLEKIKDRDSDSHQYDNIPPEVGVFAALVLLMKMVYGLDGQSR